MADNSAVDAALAPTDSSLPETAGEITAAQIRSRWERGSRAQRTQQIQYWLNRAFVYNDQWVFYDRYQDRVDQVAADDSRVHATVNKLWPNTRMVRAKALKRELTFEVDPSEPDDASITGAELSEAVLEDCHQRQDWEGRRGEQFDAAWLGGTAVLVLDWDHTAGKPLGMTEDGRAYGEGDILCAVCSVAEAVCEPGTPDGERGRWWCRGQALPSEQVRDIYRLDKTPAADAGSGGDFFGNRVVGDSSYTVTNLTRVLTYYERPSARRPKGVVASVVGEEIVDGPYPWPFPFTDRLNIAVARETRIANRWSGSTVLTAAVTVQTARNLVWSALVEHAKLAGNARLCLPDAWADGISDLTDLPGELITGSGQQMPAWLSPPNLPAWEVEMPEKLADEIDAIMGAHDLEAPAAAGASGAALGIIAEGDDTPTAGFVKELAEAWGRYATMSLETYAAKVTETRTAVVRRGAKLPQAMPWTGKSLVGQTAAKVPLDAVMPRSRAATMQWAIQLLQAGIIPPGNTTLFAQLAELANQEMIWDAVDPQIGKARRENLLLSLGTVCMPADFDDHAVHIKEHNRQRLSARYDRSSQALKSILDDHVAAHEKMAAMEAAKQVVQQAVHPALAGAASAHEPAPLPLEPMGQPGGASSPPPGGPAPVEEPEATAPEPMGPTAPSGGP